MKKFLTSALLLAGLLFPAVSQATVTSWDFAGGILQPLQSQWTANVKVPYITATSTTQDSVFPRLSFTNATGTNATTTSFFSTLGNFTNLCIGGDCKSAWPASATVAGNNTEVQFNNSGAFGASSAFTFNNALSKLTVTNGQFTNSTSTNATSTTLNVSGNVDFDLLTSALILTGAGGDLAEYAGTTCTNQFVRSLSALGAATCATVGASDVSLANLSATDSTLTFSGTYTGATARTIGLNLSNGNVWTAASSTFTGGVTIGTSTTTSATTTNMFSTTASSTNLFTSTLGVATNTPVSKLAVGQGAITVTENKLATSTSMTIDWTAGNQQLIQKGTAGITLSFSNVNPGARLTIIGCNPGSGTAGTFTWPTSPVLLWPAGTAPTQTTTANKCDLFTFAATVATSTNTVMILGGANVNY